MKIYCINCEFLRGLYNSEHQCLAPENLQYRANWLKVTEEPKKEPQAINKHNDCQWFKEK